MANKSSETQEILKEIAAVHKRFDVVDKRFDAVDKRFDEMVENKDEIMEAVGHFSNQTEARFQGIEGTLGELAKDQKKILEILEKDATRALKYDLEFTANKSAHDRFEKRLKKLEKKQAA